jgi:hypothetical protein
VQYYRSPRHSLVPRMTNLNAIKPARRLDRSFYFLLALIVAGVVSSGFGRTIGARLIHPSSPRPALLYIHAAVFASWILLFITQTGLVATRNVRLHRKLGLLGLALGVSIPIIGVATAIVMGRLRVQHGDTGAASALVISLFDMIAFTIPFGLAAYWRTSPEFHRRLMLIATCALTSAAIGRLIPLSWPDEWIYVGVDALIFLGVGRDLAVTKRLHPVYRYGIPALLFGQTTTMYLDVTGSPQWIDLAHKLIG